MRRLNRLIVCHWLAFAALVAAPPAFASGLDTAAKVSNLPFSIEGVQVMNMTTGGLTIANATGAAANLTVSNGSIIGNNISGSWSGCFGSDCTGSTASTYGVYGNGSSYGVYGNNDNGSGWGGYFTGANGVYGQSSNGTGVYGLNTNGNTWSGVFGNYTGTAYGVLGQATSYGVYGQSPNGVGVAGYNNNDNNWAGYFSGGSGVYGQGNGGNGVQGASNSGYGVYGTSNSGWAGVFEGTYGVYGQSANGGWAAQFNSTNAQNGVYISNNSNNALLCLNGQCTTSLPSPVNAVQLGAYGPGAKVGPYAFCALSGIGNPGGTDVSVNVCGGSAGAYYWCTIAQSPVQTIELTCF